MSAGHAEKRPSLRSTSPRVSSKAGCAPWPAAGAAAGPHRAVLACVPGERHTLGLIAFGLALHDLGWRITYLGADAPVRAAGHAADAVAADVVVLSGSTARDARHPTWTTFAASLAHPRRRRRRRRHSRQPLSMARLAHPARRPDRRRARPDRPPASGRATHASDPRRARRLNRSPRASAAAVAVPRTADRRLGGAVFARVTARRR